MIDVKHDPATKVTEAYVDTGTFLGMGATQYRVTSEQIKEVTPDWSRADAQGVRGKKLAAGGREPEAIKAAIYLQRGLRNPRGGHSVSLRDKRKQMTTQKLLIQRLFDQFSNGQRG